MNLPRRQKIKIMRDYYDFNIHMHVCVIATACGYVSVWVIFWRLLIIFSDYFYVVMPWKKHYAKMDNPKLREMSIAMNFELLGKFWRKSTSNTLTISKTLSWKINLNLYRRAHKFQAIKWPKMCVYLYISKHINSISNCTNNSCKCRKWWEIIYWIYENF